MPSLNNFTLKMFKTSRFWYLAWKHVEKDILNKIIKISWKYSIFLYFYKIKNILKISYISIFLHENTKRDNCRGFTKYFSYYSYIRKIVWKFALYLSFYVFTWKIFKMFIYFCEQQFWKDVFYVFYIKNKTYTENIPHF